MMMTANDGREVNVILSGANWGLSGTHSVLIEMQTSRAVKSLQFSLTPAEARAIAQRLQILANAVELANNSTTIEEKRSHQKLRK